MSPLEILRRGGQVGDEEFDSIFPGWISELSAMFWTPMEVAVRATQLLGCAPGTRILDVGSGCGKFCMIGSAISGAEFVGVEQRSDLVEVAEAIAKSQNLAEVSYQLGNMSDIDWQPYDGIYLFNPFHEQTSGPWVQIDDTVVYSKDTQNQYIDLVVQKLLNLHPGTRVATYFGFGGSFPTGFSKLAYEQFDQGPLEVWKRE